MFITKLELQIIQCRNNKSFLRRSGKFCKIFGKRRMEKQTSKKLELTSSEIFLYVCPNRVSVGPFLESIRRGNNRQLSCLLFDVDFSASPPMQPHSNTTFVICLVPVFWLMILVRPRIRISGTQFRHAPHSLFEQPLLQLYQHTNGPTEDLSFYRQGILQRYY